MANFQIGLPGCWILPDNSDNTDQAYMAPPSQGTLVALDPALFVTPPKGMAVGYLPIVTGQCAQ